MSKVIICVISIIAIVMVISTVTALPEILDVFNAKYNTAGTRLDSCDICHIPGKPNRPTCESCHVPGKPQREESLNSYGMDVKNNLNIEISQALSAIELIDSDGDRFSNIDEIRNLTFPGRKNDKPNKNAAYLPSLERKLLEMFSIP